MMRGFTAEGVYGAGPIRGEGPVSMTRSKVAMSNGKGVASPRAGAAPHASAATRGLTDDPTFWLVAMIGAAAYLAIWSAS